MTSTKWKGNRRAMGQDFFQTPDEAIIPILKYIPAHIRTIWEPTYGGGAIGKHINVSYKVIKTDKYPQSEDVKEFDFLTDTPDFKYDFIMFNPPFCLKTEFLHKCIQLGKPFMFICPVNILETAKRSKLIHDNKLSIINLSNRVNYIGQTKRKIWHHSVWLLADENSKLYYEKLDPHQLSI